MPGKRRPDRKGFTLYWPGGLLAAWADSCKARGENVSAATFALVEAELAKRAERLRASEEGRGIVAPDGRKPPQAP